MARVTLIVIAIIIVPITAQVVTLKNISNVIKNTFGSRPLNITEEDKTRIDQKLENIFENVTYELFMNWKNKEEDLVNRDFFAIFHTPYFMCNFELHKKLEDDYFMDNSRYMAKRRCGKPHCEQFKHEMDKRKLCQNEPSIKTNLDGRFFVGIDEDNTRCLTVQTERMDYLNLFKKNPAKVCLCVYYIELHSQLVSYLTYEDVTNKGVYHYTRLKSYPYDNIPEERALHYKDRKLKVTWKTLFSFDEDTLKKYKELFFMEETFQSSCNKGAFKLVSKEKYVGPSDEGSTSSSFSSSSSGLPRGKELENIASSSSCTNYSMLDSVPSSPIRAPPSPTSFSSTPSSP